jgi:hypothetical protein
MEAEIRVIHSKDGSRSHKLRNPRNHAAKEEQGNRLSLRASRRKLCADF